MQRRYAVAAQNLFTNPTVPSKRYYNGENKTRLYSIWSSMKTRCYNPKTHNFKHYGGKGVRVTAAWHDFVTFSKWALDSGYRNTLEIDRIEAAHDYCPGNCRWATQQQQALNRPPTTSRKSIFKGTEQLKSGRWRAQIVVMNRKISLGCYDTAEEAARAYDCAAIEKHGKFARPNFPQ